MKFTKMHGLGNDFILINGLSETIKESYHTLAIAMCHRHFGVGADGIMIVEPSSCADIKMRIINSDGSEAEMCGNGIRCFAKYVYEQGIVHKETMTVETLAGVLVPKLFFDENNQVTTVQVDMGEPILQRSLIPMTGDEDKAIDTSISIDDRIFQVTAVSMGNPHCVIFVDDIQLMDIATWGAKIETSKYFPKKTNVEFVQVLNDGEVIMRVWERGAAITMACGTGACATAVAAVLNKKTTRNVVVHLDGGDLTIHWDEHTNHLFMTGPAENVYEGKWFSV